jgi:hypothetical protein
LKRAIAVSFTSAAAVLVAILLAPWDSFAASVVGSRHDLSSGNPNTSAVRVTGDGGTGFDTTQTCVFCHTPHGSQSRDTVDAPLWNRGITSATYQPYQSPTLDSGAGGVAPPPDGVSLACLSCHDGTVALDLLVNRPGAGGWIDPTDPTLGGNANRIGFAFNRAGLNNTFPTTDEAGNPNVRLLGTDLRNDHPVSMVYPTIGNTDPKYHAPGATRGTGTARLDWFDDGDGVLEDHEVRLYGTKVQCASCHNPHGTSSDGTAAGPAYASFLRTTVANSSLCVTCHIK